MGQKFYTSDLHFFHRNILRYEADKRPFASKEELDSEIYDSTVQHMNRVLIDNWNTVVTPEDTVYVIGDFSMGGKTNVPLVRKQLVGKVVLVRGNHDRSKDFMLESGFDEVYDDLVVQDGDKTLWLHHQPVLFPEKWPVKTDYHLCGHVHSAWARRNNVINVGVDVSNLKPLTLEQLLTRDLIVCGWCKGEGKNRYGKVCGQCFGTGQEIDEKNGRVHRKPGEGEYK